jgi:hypothetical protein
MTNPMILLASILLAIIYLAVSAMCSRCGPK